ncbi:MAG TPA: tRNA lysidine(34) synthetase TilS [Clostridiales bacterium]|jgi:tRNA(Ile)-lysidine synthase|nr:tRNA lysidine(34) synthetase TilS [Clostridiales bacterium]
MNALTAVQNTISEHGLIAPGDSVVLGLSGGADSLCLLHILCDLQDELGFSLSSVHVNHRMRGRQAEEDVSWLVDHCAGLGIPLEVVECDVPAKAAEEKISEEEAGRQARHGALFAQAENLKAAGAKNVRVALAHNRDDQAETVLLRILRGTGIRGLAAMEYRRSDGLIRPLLDTPRTLIEAFCRERELRPRWDSTNASRDYTRNRLRLDLIPLLEEQYNPNIAEGLVRLAQHAREDESALQDIASGIAAKAVVWRMQDGERVSLALPAKTLRLAGPAAGKRAIRLLFSRIGLVQDIASTHLSALWSALAHERTGTLIEFPDGYRAEFSYGDVLFHPPAGEVSPGGQTGWTLRRERMPSGQAPDPRSLPPRQALLDAAKVEAAGGELTVRTRRPKDRIHPLGGPGSKKLQDHFVDAKVPREVRDRIPLVCIGDEVLWICGGTVNENYKAEPDSAWLLLLEITDEIW